MDNHHLPHPHLLGIVNKHTNHSMAATLNLHKECLLVKANKAFLCQQVATSKCLYFFIGPNVYNVCMIGKKSVNLPSIPFNAIGFMTILHMIVAYEMVEFRNGAI